MTYFAIDKFWPAPDEQLVAGQSIVVIPFRNMGSDPEQDILAEGFAMDLLTLLSNIDELRVVPSRTSATFANQDIDISDIRDKLNVTHILTGSVRRWENQIRVTASLIDARLEDTLWSQNYDRELSDIFRIQDEVSAEVVNHLKLELNDELPTAEEIDPQAYELYLRGKYYTHVKQTRVRTEIEESIRLLENAVELEPNFVPAIFELTRAYYDMVESGSPDTKADNLQKVYATVDRLVELAPNTSYAHGWQAWLAWRHDNDITSAAHHFEQAIRFGNDDNLYLQLSLSANFLSILGRDDEAMAVTQYVASRDPGCTPCISAVAYRYRNRGQFREAAKMVERQLAFHPGANVTYWQAGAAWLLAGEAQRALDYFERIEGDPADNMGRVLALYSLGRAEEFELAFAEYREIMSNNPEPIARIYAWSGNADEAFRWLDKHFEQRPNHMFGDQNSDFYTPIKSDPRWSALILERTTPKDVVEDVSYNPEYPEGVIRILAEIRAEATE